MKEAIGGFVLGACTVLGLVVAVISLGVEEEEPDINAAQQFLGTYFSTATADPGATWTKLTPGYVENRALSTGEPFNFEVYSDYFRGFDAITVGALRPSGDYPGWFDADVTYASNGKPDSTSHQVFQLVCPDSARYPLIGCDADDMQINRVVLNERKIENDRAAAKPQTPTCPRLRGECETFLSVEVVDFAFYGPAGAWSTALRLSNDGDYATRGCAAVDAVGSPRKFSLQPGAQKDLEILLTPDPYIGSQSIDDPAPFPEDVLLDLRCTNVRELPSGIRLQSGD